MLDRFQNILKIICVGLAALLLVKASHRLMHRDPLGDATIPPLPTLTAPAKPKETPATNKIDSVKTNSTATNAMGKARRPRRPGGPMGFPGMGGPGPAVILPAPIQARVDRIKESEILGPFMRPEPAALLGIADDDAFIRASSGQSGMVKEGGDLGGLKLLRIGINRVLVEENGEKKELTLFDGFGGDSLMPKEAEISTNASATNSGPTPIKKDHH